MVLDALRKGQNDQHGLEANTHKGRKLMDMNWRLERYIGTMWGKALYLYIGFWSLTTVGDNRDIIRFAFWKDYFGYLCEIWIFPFLCKEASSSSSQIALISVFQNKIKSFFKALGKNPPPSNDYTLFSFILFFIFYIKNVFSFPCIALETQNLDFILVFLISSSTS